MIITTEDRPNQVKNVLLTENEIGVHYTNVYSIVEVALHLLKISIRKLESQNLQIIWNRTIHSCMATLSHMTSKLFAAQRAKSYMPQHPTSYLGFVS